jgi:hypothetical protein
LNPIPNKIILAQTRASLKKYGYNLSLAEVIRRKGNRTNIGNAMSK